MKRLFKAHLALPGFALLGSVLFGGTLLAPKALAQSQAFVGDGDLGLDNFGWTVDGGTDIDGDGVSDVIGGGYRGNGIMGRIKIFSGATGALIHHVIGAQGEGIGFEVAFIDDINLDGTPDFIASGLSSPVRAYSGADASVLLSNFTGTGASGFGNMGDEDNDGTPDILVGAGVFSGADGSLIRTLPATGKRITLIGDANGDGIGDYLDSVPFSFEVALRSGADGSILYNEFLGGDGSAHRVGDVNADGHADFMLIYQGQDGYERAELRSGIDQSVLRAHIGLDFTFFAEQTRSRAASLDDVNGDGHADYVLAIDPPQLFSGADGCLLAEFVRETGTTSAFSVANAGDVNLDGRNDLVTGNPLAFGPVNQGTLTVFTYDGPVGQNYCSSSANSTGAAARISGNGSASLARNDLILVATDLPANKPGLFFYGEAQTQSPFGNGLRCVGSGAQGIFRLPVQFSNELGCMVQHIDNSNFAGGQLGVGEVWNLQAWYRDVAGGGAQFNLSDGLSVQFGL